MKRISFFLSLIFILFISLSCDKNNDLVVFPIDQDKQLGKQVSDTIASMPSQFPILSRTQYPQAYSYLDGIVQKILNSGEVTYKDEFAWEVHIIKDDSTLNAFATPGGYIYVYTGLIKYLDKEDDLAGVLGHEIAHSDQRHSMKQIRDQYGLGVVASVLLGNDPGALAEIVAGIAGQLATLKFSRSHEKEADDYSVIYLSKTPYQCNGAYSFFQKMIDEQQTGNTPEFLSTHPNPETRVEDINKKAAEIKCSTKPLDPASYASFKAMLP